MADTHTAGLTIAELQKGPAVPVWGAMAHLPNASTVAAIALAAGVSKSTTAKVLSRLEKHGYAVRTRGGPGKPDTWRPVPDPGPSAATADAAPSDNSDAHEPAATASDANAKAKPATASAAAGPATAVPDLALVQELSFLLTMAGNAVRDAQSAITDARYEVALERSADLLEVAREVPKAARDALAPRRTASGRAVVRRGELQAKVLAHLAKHRDKDFTPYELGRAIGHSPGAVANALDLATSIGSAVMTCDKPRRYAGLPRNS